MKVRNGFVSNSSSSSFLIMTTKDVLDSKKLLEIFDVKDTSPIYSLIENLSDDIVRCTEKLSNEDFLDNYAWGDTLEEKEENLKDEYKEYYEHYINAKKNNWNIYYGSADSYEESNVANLVLHHEDDDILISMTGDK